MIALWLLVAVAFLAYTNGANDNFKGVATLFGSGTRIIGAPSGGPPSRRLQAPAPRSCFQED